MPTLADEILRSKTVSTVDGAGRLPLKDNIDGEIGQLLQKLIEEKRPKMTLEVGLAYGVSGLFICEALRKVGGEKHIAIDAFQSTIWSGIGLHHLRQAGYEDLLELREELSQDALPEMVKEGVRVDFAFVDGTHSFDQKMVDFYYVDRLLNVGGVIAFDDCQWTSIHRVCRFIATNRPYRVCGTTYGTPPGWRGKLARTVARRLGSLRRVMNPQFTVPDEQLGILAGARCIAFEKLAEYKVMPDYKMSEF